MNSKIRGSINFYPFVLWNTVVFGRKNKRITNNNNLYEKEVELLDGDLRVKENRIRTDIGVFEIEKANPVEYLFYKYIPVLILLFLFMQSFNLYFVSTTGLFIGSFAYIMYRYLEKKFSLSISYIFLSVLFFLYILFFLYSPLSALEFKAVWIINYSIQYFLFFYLLQTVIRNLLSEKMNNIYKIKKYVGTFIRFKSDNEIKEENRKKKLQNKFYYIFLIILMFFGALFGLVDIAYKVQVNKEAQKRVLTENEKEALIIEKRNSEALARLLEKQSKEVGIRVHTKKDLELLKKDFSRYLDTKVIAYENILITENTKIIDVKTRKELEIRTKRPKILVRAWVKKFDDGFFRWHFASGNKIAVVMSVKAR